jgi:hypothetical protein
MIKMTIKTWYGWLDEIVIAIVPHLSLLLFFVLQISQKLRLSSSQAPWEL